MQKVNPHLSKLRTFRCWYSVIWLALVPSLLAAQAVDRRGYFKPELSIFSHGMTARCNCLRFSSDASRLLAAGEDKVVRVWPISEGKFDRDATQVLRWASWREQRGAINAMATFERNDQTLIAIGGHGIRNASIAVIDQQTGNVVHGLTEPAPAGDDVTAIAFGPTGGDVVFGDAAGNLWNWNFANKSPRLLGTHPVERERANWNQVLSLVVLPDNRIRSFAQGGALVEWSIVNGRVQQKIILNVPMHPAVHAGSTFRSAISENGERFAIAYPVPHGDTYEYRLLWGSFEGNRHSEVFQGQDIVSLSLNPSGDRLALALAQKRKTIATQASTRVQVRESNDPQRVAFSTEIGGRVSQVALTADGSQLAVAGFDDHEIRVFDVKNRNLTDQIESEGSTIWQVAVSPDNSWLGFRNERNPNAPSPNALGRGPGWTTFNLSRRRFDNAPDSVNWRQAIESIAGWKVERSDVDAFSWSVVDPTGRNFAIPWDAAKDGQPRCWTFLEASAAQPVRLAIGHRWGASIFELRPGQPPRRIRLFTGHQGEVVSIVSSANQRILITGSTDQSIAAWSLAPWPRQSELGANFRIEGDKIVVEGVTPGSPAWEAELEAGDEILAMVVGGNEFVYDPTSIIDPALRVRVQRKASAADCLKYLSDPVPTKEIWMRLAKKGDRLTTVRQRPLWRFFPTKNQDWVIWRWRDYYYDTSIDGDSLVGWQINKPDVNLTPEFFRAEQFRARFHDPKRIEDILRDTFSASERIMLPEMLPPKVSMTVEPGANELSVLIQCSPRSDLVTASPREVSLWINEYRFKKFEGIREQFSQTVTVPRSVLRSGTNRIIAHVINEYGFQNESEIQEVEGPTPNTPPKLYGVTAGISEYAGITAQPVWSDLLWSVDDARLIHEICQSQGGTRLYGAATSQLFTNQEVTRDRILTELISVQKKCKPNDILVLYVSGHGTVPAEIEEADPAIAKTILARGKGSGNTKDNFGDLFAFVTPGFNYETFLALSLDESKPWKQRQDCGIDSDTLHETLCQLPCRKVIIIDACRSAGGAKQYVRGLAPHRVGPVIMTAASENESAYELPFITNGLFTESLREALEEHFDQLDVNKDDFLSPAELFAYIRKRVPEFVKSGESLLGPDAKQTPVLKAYNPADALEPLFGRPRT